MTTTIGAISPLIPTPGVVKTDAGTGMSPDRTVSQAGDAATGGAGASAGDAIAPVPIQPLSNWVLATFMQKDIELYGSMFGA